MPAAVLSPHTRVDPTSMYLDALQRVVQKPRQKRHIHASLASRMIRHSHAVVQQRTLEIGRRGELLVRSVGHLVATAEGKRYLLDYRPQADVAPLCDGRCAGGCGDRAGCAAPRNAGVGFAAPSHVDPYDSQGARLAAIGVHALGAARVI